MNKKGKSCTLMVVESAGNQVACLLYLNENTKNKQNKEYCSLLFTILRNITCLFLYRQYHSVTLPEHRALFSFCFKIDPYRGNIFRDLTWAVTINHSRQHPNLKPFMVDQNSSPCVFQVALHNTPATVEFLRNYNNPSCYFHRNNQTPP